MSKILILTSSPQRDKLIDKLLEAELRNLGNTVFWGSFPTPGRKAILKLKPDILVMGPITNLYMYDTAFEASRWGVAVVIRHVEPGFDESDVQVMTPFWKKTELFAGRPSGLKLELVWGDVEAKHLKNRPDIKHDIVPVGAFVADIYKKPSRKNIDLIKGHGLNPDKKTVLVSAPWGLFDMESDFRGQSSDVLAADQKGMSKWLQMVCELKEKLTDFNILTTLHPGLLEEKEYQSVLGAHNIPVDTKSTAFDLLSSCDVLVHAGSTMAIEMHWLNKPAFQFGDVNSLDMPDANWWQRAGAPISQVSPFFTENLALIKAIATSSLASNADTEVITQLEKGRYGKMDGKATKRAASLINKLTGKCEIKWPLSLNTKDTAFGFRDTSKHFTMVRCLACEEAFFCPNDSYIELLKWSFGIEQELKMPLKFECPWCGSLISIRRYK